MTTGSSLLTPEVTTMVTGFANQIVPTVIALLLIIVPVGLTCWGIAFGVVKGLGYLQKKAKESIPG